MTERKVHFQLPTPEELDWERTRRGFFARERHKLRKKGLLPMRTITVKTVKMVEVTVEEVTVEVEDHEDIDQFLEILMQKNTNEPEKVKDLMKRATPNVILQVGGPGDWVRTLQELKDTYRNTFKKDYAVSKWLQEARKEGCYPFPESNDETEAVATPGANRKATEQGDDGDAYLEKGMS
ncbi:hypothetical protein ACA910_002084 [Epithemia clementina (nom. ined.)]